MGWFSWLFGEKEEKPPEQLVLGAELACPYGTEHSFLIVQSDDMDINGLPEACVLDREKFVNIMPFGKCQYFLDSECDSFMVLDEKWENPEPQAMQINGEEIITTKSTLICMASGKEIKAVTSGQDGIIARWLEKEKEIDEKYPGLRARLMDPNGSLYLDGEMYREAIRFIEDCVEKYNGELKIADIFDESDLEMVLIRTAMGKLIPSCDERRIEKLIDGLEIRGTVNDMDSVPGWDPHLLNKAMVEMLKRDSVITAELVETKSFYKWQEKHILYGDELAKDTMKFAYQALAFHLIMASAPAWGAVGPGDESGTSKQTEARQRVEEAVEGEGGSGIDFDLSKLSRSQQTAIKSADNIINDHLKSSDLSAALGDLQGNPIAKPNGGYWNHAQEVKDAYTGLVRAEKTLAGSLQNPNLAPDARAFIQGKYDTISNYISIIEDMFASYGGIN